MLPSNFCHPERRAEPIVEGPSGCRQALIWHGSLLAIVLLLPLTNLVAQEPQPKIISSGDLPQHSDLGPLIFRQIEPAHGWISVAWDLKTPAYGRRCNGKIPGEKDSLFLSIQLAYIKPRFCSCSDDSTKREQSRLIFTGGVKKLLENERTFWFESVHGYTGPGQIGGVFLLDDYSGTTLQSEMVRCGYAVVVGRDSWEMIEKYRDDYRDKLLRLEGEAKAYKLGVWSEP